MKSKFKIIISRAILPFGLTLIGFMIGFFADIHELATLSNANHGYTKHAVMEGIRNEDVEYCAIFLGPIKVLEYTDHDPETFSISEELIPDKIIQLLIKYRNYVAIIHNHPNAHSDNSFSLTDVSENNIATTKIMVSKYSTQKLKTQQYWPTVAEIDAIMRDSYNISLTDEITYEYDPYVILAKQDLIYINGRWEWKSEDGMAKASIKYECRTKLISEISEQLGVEFSIEKVE